jgi:hypothetical protein
VAELVDTKKDKAGHLFFLFKNKNYLKIKNKIFFLRYLFVLETTPLEFN